MLGETNNQFYLAQVTSYKKKHGSAHVDRHVLQGIVTVSYKTYRDTYRNTYQISQYVSFVEKVYRYTPKVCLPHYTIMKCLDFHIWIKLQCTFHGNLCFHNKKFYKCNVCVVNSDSNFL